MPTYDYVCTACDHEFEEFQSMTARPLTKCPACGKPKLQRKIGIGAGVLFKGGGFYETDYRSESYKKAAEADAKPADTKPADSGAKAESKPESKPEPAKPQAAAASSTTPAKVAPRANAATKPRPSASSRRKR